MRRSAVFCIFLSILFLFSACSLPFGLHNDAEEETTEEVFTYVITTEQHVGVQKLTDQVNWYANTLVAMHYVSTRANVDSALRSLQKNSFPALDESDLTDLHRVDIGGNDAVLVIPRFDQSSLSVFTIAIDSEGTVHILNQAADLREPFLLLCNASEHPNAQVGVSLADVSGRFRAVVRKDPENGGLQYTESSFQPLRLLEE